MTDSKPVYLDYNATTPLAPEVVEAVTSALAAWGNPSSGYRTGREARARVEAARAQVAEMVGAEPEEVTFTSGGTEANHLAIWAALELYRGSDPAAVITRCPSPETRAAPACHPATSSRGLPHIVTSNIEHPAVTAPLAQLEARGWATVTRVPVVRGSGRWSVASMLEAVTPDTCLVTVMLANNETGILQPVKELFSALRASAPPTRVPILLHTDAAQAIGKIPVSGPELGADLVTIVGHKFYGPRIGALYHRKGVAVSPTEAGHGEHAHDRGAGGGVRAGHAEPGHLQPPHADSAGLPGGSLITLFPFKLTNFPSKDLHDPDPLHNLQMSILKTKIKTDPLQASNIKVSSDVNIDSYCSTNLFSIMKR